jgi:hypothetical protein
MRCGSAMGSQILFARDNAKTRFMGTKVTRLETVELKQEMGIFYASIACVARETLIRFG